MCRIARDSAKVEDQVQFLARTLDVRRWSQTARPIATCLGKAISTAAIEKEIQRQERKLVVLDADCLKPVQDEIRRLRRELEQAQRAKQAAAAPADLQQRIDQAVQDFFRLPEVLADKDSMKLRNYLQRTIAGVRLTILPWQQGQRRQYRLVQGAVYGQFSGRGPQIDL